MTERSAAETTAEFTARTRRVLGIREDDGDAFWTEAGDDEYDEVRSSSEARRAEARAEREREWRAAADLAERRGADLAEKQRRLVESEGEVVAYMAGLAGGSAVPEPLRGERRARLPIPKKVKKQVWKRDGGQCRNCGITDSDAVLRDGEHLHFDHIIPFSRNGADTVDNIQLLCGQCNREKAYRFREP